MFKKSLLTVAFIATALIMTGCNSEENAPEKIDYIVTTELPTEAMAQTTDRANANFVKIWPHFKANEIPAGKKKIKWFKTGLGSKIPAFPEGRLMEVINTDTDFAAYIGNVDAKMFQNYFEKLAAAGFHFYDDRSWESLSMYNDKYEVNMRFCQDGPNLTLVRVRVFSPEEAANAAKALGITPKPEEAKDAAKDTAKDAKEAKDAAKTEKPAEEKAKETKK